MWWWEVMNHTQRHAVSASCGAFLFSSFFNDTHTYWTFVFGEVSRCHMRAGHMHDDDDDDDDGSHRQTLTQRLKSFISPRGLTAMALEADGDRGSSRSAHEKCPRAALERNGYVKTCVTPLHQDAGSQSWLRLAVTWTRRGVSSAVCVASVSVILALLLRLVDWDAGCSSSSSSSSGNSSGSDSRLHFAADCAAELLLSACYCVSPVFTLVCAFFWVGLYLIRCGLLIRTALFLLALCHLGEAAAQSLLRGAEEQLLSVPATLVVLGCLGSGALLVVRLRQGVSVLVSISVIRAVSLVSLCGVRASWRPYLAYLLGLLGVLLARYADRLLPASGTSGTGCCGSVTGAKEEDIPVFKRRRRSSSIAASEMMAHSQSNSKSHRRTSLPCIPRDQVRHVQLLRTHEPQHLTTCVFIIYLLMTFSSYTRSAFWRVPCDSFTRVPFMAAGQHSS